MKEIMLVVGIALVAAGCSARESAQKPFAEITTAARGASVQSSLAWNGFIVGPARINNGTLVGCLNPDATMQSDGRCVLMGLTAPTVARAQPVSADALVAAWMNARGHSGAVAVVGVLPPYVRRGGGRIPISYVPEPEALVFVYKTMSSP